jgi:ribosomal protein S18 acetylase RimI-like enzyme
VSVSIRALTPDDAEAVVALYQRTHAADPTVPEISLGAWRRFAAAGHNQGGRDFRLAVAGGVAVGIATTSQRAQAEPWLRHFRIIVEPAWRRRGIGRALLVALAEIDASRPALMQTLCPEDWIAGAAFLAAAGFVPLERELDMECAALAPPPPAPAGIALRRIAEPAALAAPLAALHNHAYAGTPSFVQLDASEMAEILADGMLWVAEAIPPRPGARGQGGEGEYLSAERRDSPSSPDPFAPGRTGVVALCHVEPEGRKLRLESLAVDPAWQGRGIGAALAHRAFSEAGASAERVACLSVSDQNPAALRAYARLGFRTVFASTRYRAEGAHVLAAPAN